MSNLFIMSNANAQPQEPHPFHLELASFDVLIARPSSNSSPLHDLFNLFSSIKKLHANRFTFNIGELQFPLDRRVSISQFSYDSDGELETGIIDELVPILFRDIINPSSVKTIHAWLPMIDDLEDMSQLIDKTFKFMDGPLSIDFTLSSRDADSSMEVEYETQRSHIPLSPAVTAATYTLQLSGEDDDQEYFDTVVNKYLSQHPPNIRSFTLEIETDGDLTNEENIELFQTFEWSDFGQTMHEWGTLEHLEIMISLGKYEQGLDVQVRELRDAIMEEMEPAKDILKSVTIRFL
ncbi:hypothetical protein QCA50_000618 [Cerrena zonata]|uniref:Uncharacterized protein n=1 Tax=Cerrena zonata TaxID=2478898 RepID=A0AAW0GRG9_9APHY